MFRHFVAFSLEKVQRRRAREKKSEREEDEREDGWPQPLHANRKKEGWGRRT